ncbi:hypothetical protein M413DRAFT_25924 [Hebeloma cylindrosporum]|uniref:Uncharacterized protein n=1 Tax=Hebeloma cylindrosporum TaxID=76867 RepID=A0A0C3C3Y2_HEBCY|nr:hypothetical protein M413DRAFT_25924 [Hebeloma cylindrosporum h7]
MWRKNLKSSPPSAKESTSRLLAAAVLTQAEIPCVVWGEEALAWIHRVPTLIFYTLHLLVPESQLEKASQTLASLLPEYASMDPRSDYADGWIVISEKKKFQEQGRFPHASPLSRRFIHIALDAEKKANQTQNSVRQTLIPEFITLTPDSFFHLSATDTTSLVSLPEPIPPSLEDVRFPTLSTMYDALFSTINAPERSQYSFGLGMQLEQYLAYLHLYCFSEYVREWYKEVEDLPEPIREVGLALRPENKPRFWAMWLRDEPYSDDSDDDCNWRNAED